jgi:hypothetical protein
MGCLEGLVTRFESRLAQGVAGIRDQNVEPT